jgi:hypothetical protein
MSATYCDRADLLFVKPNVGNYQKKNLILGWTSLGSSLYRSDATGYIDTLYKDGKELGATVSESAVTYADAGVNTDETFAVGDTTLTLESSGGDDSDIVAGQFIRLEESGEKMLIIAESGDDLTVARGLFDTSQVQQSGGADVYVGGGLLLDQSNEWIYDAYTDALFMYSSTDPETTMNVESGTDFKTLQNEAIKRASDFIRAYINKPILPRKGTKSADATGDTYEEIITRSTAYLSVSYLLRGEDDEEADYYEAKALNPEKTGWLDMVKSGDIKLWNEPTERLGSGVVSIISQDASSTGAIIDTKGYATCEYDLILVKITTGGTFESGTTSPVQYSSYISNAEGLQMQLSAENETVDGSHQSIGRGISVRFSEGVYVADDSFSVEVNGEWITTGSIKNAQAYR